MISVNKAKLDRFFCDGLKTVCRTGDLDVASELIRIGYRPKLEHLLAAAHDENSNGEMMVLLLQYGTFDRRELETILYVTLTSGSSRATYALLKERPDIDLSLNDYRTFKIACRIGRIKLVKLMLKIGVDIHSDNDYAIRAVCESKLYMTIDEQLEMVELLLENGADIHANNDKPLQSAMITTNPDLVYYLVKHGANVHAVDDLRRCIVDDETDLRLIEIAEIIDKKVEEIDRRPRVKSALKK